MSGSSSKHDSVAAVQLDQYKLIHTRMRNSTLGSMLIGHRATPEQLNFTCASCCMIQGRYRLPLFFLPVVRAEFALDAYVFTCTADNGQSHADRYRHINALFWLVCRTLAYRVNVRQSCTEFSRSGCLLRLRRWLGPVAEKSPSEHGPSAPCVQTKRARLLHGFHGVTVVL